MNARCTKEVTKELHYVMNAVTARLDVGSCRLRSIMAYLRSDIMFCYLLLCRCTCAAAGGLAQRWAVAYYKGRF